jgi:hypothetical protein
MDGSVPKEMSGGSVKRVLIVILVLLSLALSAVPVAAGAPIPSVPAVTITWE